MNVIKVICENNARPCVKRRMSCYKGYYGSGSPYSVGDMDWTEDDTVKTTMNGISNITFIKRRHACRTEVLKNGDGRTDASSLCLAPGRTDRTRRLL